MKRRRTRTPLSVIAEALQKARAHSDGSSIVPVSSLVLHLWGAKLEETGGGAPGAPNKALLHVNWALKYWTRRVIEPADIEGAVRAAQEFTRIYPWEAPPTAATVKRVARRHWPEILRSFRADRSVNLEPLLAYRKKHARRGRQ
jgi:hypothetical protein